MKNTTDYAAAAQKNETLAHAVILKSGIIPAWKNIGAEINLVGSLKIGTLGKHPDIDFHTYTPELDIRQSFAVMAQIAQNPQARHIEFVNLADTEECCFEWHIWFDDNNGTLWQIDIIQIKRGTKYDGYFEKQAEEIKAAMNEEMRQTIIRLKFETPDNFKIAGIEYYKAVIQDGITNFDDFLKWRKSHNFEGIIKW
ncbi:MAG: phosphoglycerate mutase family protein [Alphaproteobacteria bacterium]